MALQGERETWRDFLSSEIRNVFACSSTTSDAMDKWRPQLDSARQIGPESTLTDFLIVVEAWFTGG